MPSQHNYVNTYLFLIRNMTMTTLTAPVGTLSSERGVVLLEALIAILIFSFGILGLVGLQAASIKNVGEAQYRVEAALHADSVIAQMRAANPASREADFKTDGGTVSYGYTAWKNRVIAAGLPGAAATRPTVTFSGAAPNQLVTIKVSWRAQTDTGTRSYVTTTQLD